jgi:hypothetical protein
MEGMTVSVSRSIGDEGQRAAPPELTSKIRRLPGADPIARHRVTAVLRHRGMTVARRTAPALILLLIRSIISRILDHLWI